MNICVLLRAAKNIFISTFEKVFDFIKIKLLAIPKTAKNEQMQAFIFLLVKLSSWN